MQYFETYCNDLKGFLGVPQKDKNIAKYAVLLQTVSELWTICGQWIMWKYSSGSRGRPAKALARISVARVQIPPSTPRHPRECSGVSSFIFLCRALHWLLPRPGRWVHLRSAVLRWSGCSPSLSSALPH